MRTIIASLILAVVLTGCGKKENAPPAAASQGDPLQEALKRPSTEQKAEQSDVGAVLDAITGKQAVNRGRDVADKLNKIQADRQKQLEELDALD